MTVHTGHLQVKTSRTFLRDCTVISPLALLLFGGPLSVAHAGGYVSVDRFRVRWQCRTHLQQLEGPTKALRIGLA